ncbi:MAG: hypothetical protein ACPGF7_08880 [Pontibacterium sp.]
MNKIIKAIKVMVSNPEKITGAVKGQHETECFFRYDEKHHWSILETNDKHYFLNYFPDQPNLNSLASIPDESWQELSPNSVVYNTKDLAAKEAIDSSRELYSIVNEKLYGMDHVLDDIINGNIPSH